MHSIRLGRSNDQDGQGRARPRPLNRSRGQRGSALILLLGVVVFLTLIAIGVSAFADANLRATDAYESARSTRYSADAAIKSATNWIAHNDDVAVDPLYKPDANEDCVYHSTAASGEVITVSCESEPGSGGGVPGDVGLNPPEAIFLSGDRHNEPGTYNYSKCSSIWDELKRFFTGDTPGVSEKGLYTSRRERSTWGGVGSCALRDRGRAPLKIEGNIVAAGRISLKDGFKLLVGGGTSGGLVRARHDCEFDAGGTPANRILNFDGSPANVQCMVGGTPKRDASTDVGMPWEGTYLFKDPGRISSSTSTTAATPIGDIRDAFLPIGFDADGSLKAGYTLPTRTTAYQYDPTANVNGTAEIPKFLKELTTTVGDSVCDIPNGTPVIFLWGQYESADVLNRYTSDPACADRTFWFAPNPGPDKTVLTGDDLTAAFYMNFSETAEAVAAAVACGGMEGTDYARWCLGGSSPTEASKPRVVVGWPKDWTALPTEAPGGSGTGGIGYGNRVGAYLDTAGAVEGNFLSYWTNTPNSRVVDQQVATYKPCAIPVFWWVINCPSFGTRTLRLTQFTPKVAGGPIAEVGNPAGLIKLDVNFGMKNATGLTPRVSIDYLSPSESVAKNCGTFNLDTSAVLTNFSGGNLPLTSKGTLSVADQQTLAQNCGAVDAINNMRVTFLVEGNPWNSNSPTIYLDGVRIYYDSYQGASFPLPVDADGNIQPIGSTQPVDPAKSDCDTTKPGGQLIFGGESHVYAADGSLEVCGGPNPDDPDGSLVIGVYGVPAVETRQPTAVAIGAPNDDNTRLDDPAKAKVIGEASGRADLNITYDNDFFGTAEANVDLTFPSIGSLPNGYRIGKVSARYSYDSNNPGPRLGWGTNARLHTLDSSGSRLWTTNAPLTGSILQVHDLQRDCGSSDSMCTTLFERGSVNRFGGSTTDDNPLSVARKIQWSARATSGLSDWTDQLDGVALDITLVPTGVLASAGDVTTPILRPQSGCIVAHPNYDGGESDPDCALVRADGYSPVDSPDGGLCLGSCPGRRTNWFGRVSVKGTIYAPSAAVEIDDNDIGYPLATRGMILRHLRVSGSRPRSGYTDPLIGGTLDKVPNDRVAVLTACLQSTVRRDADEPCDESAGDRELARSGVVFTVDPGKAGDPLPQADVPKVRWYTDEVTGS